MKMMERAKRFLQEKKKAVVTAMAAFAVVVALNASGPATASHAAAVDFTGTTLPFTVPDMIATATNFLTMYGQWILLALGVIFAPVLYGLAMRLVSAVKARAGAK